jgi:hypothetical protein
MADESFPISKLRERQEPQLRCPSCENDELFIEIMDLESHLVGGDLRYIRLLDAVTDHYICAECGKSIEPDWLKQQKGIKIYD